MKSLEGIHPNFESAITHIAFGLHLRIFDFLGITSQIQAAAVVTVAQLIDDGIFPQRHAHDITRASDQVGGDRRRYDHENDRCDGSSAHSELKKVDGQGKQDEPDSQGRSFGCTRHAHEQVGHAHYTQPRDEHEYSAYDHQNSTYRFQHNTTIIFYRKRA